jgi:Ohr subfamily peroxiredoxin
MRNDHLATDDRRLGGEDRPTMVDDRRPIYTARARVTGGRAAGHGRSSDGALEVDLRTPPELGGEGVGTNPEQLFAVGYAACFESALGTVARRRRLDAADIAIDSSVMLMPTEGRGFALAVTLAITLPSIDDPVDAVELVRAAHMVCPYSNATRGNIGVALAVNGHTVEPADSVTA